MAAFRTVTLNALSRNCRTIAASDPVCLYLETTNRCNLLCETCPRTFEELEPPADMSWELFTSIVGQFPKIERVVLHGVGEPMMVRELPRMIRYLKDLGTYVLFNTNGTLLNLRKGRELIDTGLDELRVSLDAAEPTAFKMVRGLDMFDRIVANIRDFTAMQRELNATTPRVSLWLTGLKETLAQLPAFVRLAYEVGVPEVYLQRLVYFPGGQSLPPEQAQERRSPGTPFPPQQAQSGARRDPVGASGVLAIRATRCRAVWCDSRGRRTGTEARDSLQRLGSE